jgi:hypothetical protein
MNKLKLKVFWSKKEQDFMVSYPRKCDGGWILHRLFGSTTTILSNTTGEDCGLKKVAPASHNPYLSIFEVEDFVQELIKRGYDKTTIKFEVQIDISKLQEKFPHILESLSDKEKKQLKLLKKKSK